MTVEKETKYGKIIISDGFMSPSGDTKQIRITFTAREGYFIDDSCISRSSAQALQELLSEILANGAF
jgi:hypothetical protein